MSTATNLKAREIIHQVVNDPQYKKVSAIPLFSTHQIGLMLFSYVLFGLGIYAIYAGISPWLAYPIMVFGCYTAFTPLHDATHQAVSSNKTINDLIGTVSGNLLFPFVNTTMYRYFHLAHHRYVGNHELDPDEAMVAIPTKYFPFGYLIFFVYEYFIFKWFFKTVWHRTPSKTKWVVTATLAANLIFQFIMFSSPYWYEFLIWFFIPNRLGVAYTTYTFAHLPHPEGVQFEEHPFQSTYTLRGNKFILQSFWGQDNHSMHHFLPHIPWYKYVKVWDLANGVFRTQSIPDKQVFSAPDLKFKQNMLNNGITDDGRRTLTAKITVIQQVTGNIKSFTFAPINGEHFPPATAGAHIDLTLPSGKIRSYSLINPSYETDTYQIAVKKEEHGRGGSRELHDTLRIGDLLSISTPKNHFVLYENVQHYILIAGGIGITPLISMAHRLTELQKSFEFHICAKDAQEVPFQFELENWSFAPNVEIHIDQQGNSSLPLAQLLAKPNAQTLVYVCGPSGFNRWIKQTAVQLGWQKDQLKEEVFSMDTTAFSAPKSFELVLQKSNKTIQVTKDQTMIDALLMNNVKVEYSCLQGTCGTCIAPVIEGAIDHRDSVLNQEEQQTGNKVCLCVSRAKNERLIVDL